MPAFGFAAPGEGKGSTPVAVAIGDAEGSVAAVSVLGTASSDGVAVGFSGAEGGVVAASAGTARGDVAVGRTADGGVAAAGLLASQAALVAATAAGPADAPVAVSGLGSASGGALAIAGRGAAGADTAALSGLGEARAGTLAASATEPAIASDGAAASAAQAARGDAAASGAAGSDGGVVGVTALGDACPAHAEGEPLFREPFAAVSLGPAWLPGYRRQGEAITWGTVRDDGLYGLWLRGGEAWLAGQFRNDTLLGLASHGLRDGVVSFEAWNTGPALGPLSLVVASDPELASATAYELEFDLQLLARPQAYRVVMCNEGRSVQVFLGEERIGRGSLPGAAWLYFRVGDAGTWLILDNLAVAPRGEAGLVAVAGAGEAEASLVAVSGAGHASAGPGGIAVSPLDP